MATNLTTQAIAFLAAAILALVGPAGPGRALAGDKPHGATRGDKNPQIVGWRGNWTGSFPDAAIPTTWGRVSKLMMGVQTQAKKPEGDKPNGESANGMTYIAPNHCFCEPYLPGTMAFHTRRFAGEQGGNRLKRGAASAAPAKPGPGWPMYLCDNRRSAWTEQTIPSKLAPLWTTKPAGEPPAELLARSWADHWFAQGPLTQASVAEGVVVVGLSHRQQVLALDPASRRFWGSPSMTMFYVL